MPSPRTPALRPGDQLASATGTPRFIVIRAPQEVTDPVECGGSPMVPAQEAPAAQPDGQAPDTLIGKRYVDPADTLELLCTASGTGRLTYRGKPLAVKPPKALPASD
ncbi:hypothetical protein KMT30_11605 [Streptomyces sp. IBSBF 2953]|uniref:hypothetical protein n=1 Tax=Streptomyces TaxID=1883 RepID=UPI00211A8B4C|nr:hypothetical protein [Streptomyces scabiei]MCQ9179665.1 hypothetical protein [Streptomyces hayashii]MDX3116804.1 hypothetical protein [Streptomyces scabiei]